MSYTLSIYRGCKNWMTVQVDSKNHLNWNTILLPTLGLCAFGYNSTLADPGGARDPPPGVQILSFSCSFQQKSWKIIALLKVGAAPRENPGSATAVTSILIQSLTNWSLHYNLFGCQFHNGNYQKTTAVGEKALLSHGMMWLLFGSTLTPCRKFNKFCLLQDQKIPTGFL